MLHFPAPPSTYLDSESIIYFIEGISICILPMVHVRNVTYIFQKCNIENGGVHVMNAGTT